MLTVTTGTLDVPMLSAVFWKEQFLASKIRTLYVPLLRPATEKVYWLVPEVKTGVVALFRNTLKGGVPLFTWTRISPLSMPGQAGFVLRDAETEHWAETCSAQKRKKTDSPVLRKRFIIRLR